MKILEITFDGTYYKASTPPPQGKDVIGGPYNLYGVDGTDATAVIQAAIDYADIIDARILQVKK
jgi:hypothetical protein